MKTVKTKVSKPKRNSQRMELERLKAKNPCINELIENLDLVLVTNVKSKKQQLCTKYTQILTTASKGTKQKNSLI